MAFGDNGKRKKTMFEKLTLFISFVTFYFLLS